MRALIVDDERLARKELMKLLEEHPSVEVVGEATNADEADKMIEELNPDLLFLDIQMPGRTGFQLLDVLTAADVDRRDGSLVVHVRMRSPIPTLRVARH